ncbi:hypothetical protein [Streptomyces goshikiensis]|uniref:hypothetical protein n=1 Tax=Streptomyces goshikiensis TaxID=1942 RepID=UPI003658C099
MLLLTEAYRHGKVIGGWNGAQQLLETAGIGADELGIALGGDGAALVGTVAAALAEQRAWNWYSPAV